MYIYIYIYIYRDMDIGYQYRNILCRVARRVISGGCKDAGAAGVTTNFVTIELLLSRKNK